MSTKKSIFSKLSVKNCEGLEQDEKKNKKRMTVKIGGPIRLSSIN